MATRFLASVTAALLFLPITAFAQITVISSGGFRAAYQTLLPLFEKSTGLTVTTGRGGSQGNGPNTIGAQLSRGVHADVVIMTRVGLNALIAEGRIEAGTDVDLAKVPLGLGVRAGARKPDISTVEAVKQTLLAAKSIAYESSTVPYMEDRLLPGLGIAAEIERKFVDAGPADVATGKAEIIIAPVSEILHAPGTAFVGSLPAEIEETQLFSAAIVSGSKELQASQRLIKYLASADARSAIEASGMEPVR
ncbi:MAG TPA: substrate-binding domain-containing protein [Steroidobacteraceae bacterium]|jgi:molybdate transport system substrate-binding protein|nr:substrate-binding domain-containing protein [Steroidobacteraceae bacterium]